MTQSDKKDLRLISGTVWMVAMRWSMRVAGFISTLILARLLAPEDFGIIAMAKVALGFVEALSTSGSELALIRTRDRSEELYNTAWTIRLIQRSAMALLLFLAAPLATAYFEEPRTLVVIQVLAAATLLKGFINIGTVDFRKDLNFSAEFRLGVITKLSSVLIAIGLAITLRNYWALVLAITVEALLNVILSYIVHPYRPRFSLARWHELWLFSTWILATRLAYFANARVDQIMVGGAFNTSVMGYYNFGTELGTLPGDEIAEPLKRSVYPNLSTLAADRDAFARTTVSVLSMTALLIFPLGFGLAAVAPSFVPVVLGEKWIPTTSVLAIAAVYGSFSGLTKLLEVPLQIIGKERIAAWLWWSQVATLIPLVTYALKSGEVFEVAVARAITVLLAFIAFSIAATRALQLRPMALISSLWRSIVAASLMAFVVFWCSSLLNLSYSIELLGSVVLGVVLYPSFMLTLWTMTGRPSGAESTVLKMLKQRLKSQSEDSSSPS